MDEKSIVPYIAGFFDGEGCILVSRGKNAGCTGGWNYTLSVGASQQHRGPLDIIAKRYGGKVNKSDPTGRSGGSWRKKSNYIFVWKVCNFSALDFLEEIEPFLVVKKDQALIALEWPRIKGIKQKPLPDSVREKREEILERLRVARAVIKEEVS